jgi:hypothetical protein
MMAVDRAARVGRKSGVMSAPVDDDLVILNPDRDDYVALDQIGRRIWELLEEQQTVGELCERLAAEFTGEREQIAADVMAFLDRLRDEGLVDVGGGQPS